MLLALMAIVGRRRGIPFNQVARPLSRRRSTHRSRRNPPEDTEVPPRFRHPHFKIDVRVAGRRRKPRDPESRESELFGVEWSARKMFQPGTICAVVMVVFGRWKLLASCVHVKAVATPQTQSPRPQQTAHTLRLVACFVR